jgi:hypothetical protein
MSDATKGINGAKPAGKKDGTEDVVSVARRRAMKIGITAVPVILTLRGKPLFGQVTPSIAASIAAGSSIHAPTTP